MTPKRTYPILYPVYMRGLPIHAYSYQKTNPTCLGTHYEGKHVQRWTESACIRHMKVSVYPIRLAGSWVYLTRSWREATQHFIVIQVYMITNEAAMFKFNMSHVIKLKKGVKIITYCVEIIV